MAKVSIRSCARCEWLFKTTGSSMCPKCGMGSYPAHSIHGKATYSFVKTQEPWKKKKLEEYAFNLDEEIKYGQTGEETNGSSITDEQGPDSFSGTAKLPRTGD